MGNIVGIDLGTTNSVAAFKWSNEAEVATDDKNRPMLVRSVVAIDNGEIVVGQSNYLYQDSTQAIASVKRLMGRSFNDRVVQEQKSRFNYKITPPTRGTENSLSVWLENTEYQPEEISAKILEWMAKIANQYQHRLGRSGNVTHAVVTIPAYFNDKQRYATQTAVNLAGLTLIELLPEPTAAAIAYSFQPNSDDAKTILVYDFGGGTFDSSLIVASGNQFIETGKAGDLWLGGDDIDAAIMDWVKAQVAREEGIANIDELIAEMPQRQQNRFLGDLKTAAERAKIDLSHGDTAPIIPSTPLLDELGMQVPIEVEITRDRFDELILPIVERTIAICHEAIAISEYPPDMVDLVLLVGGSSQIPLVQQKVREAFGADKVALYSKPMQAVAQGAAIVAAGLTEKVGTVSRDYAIELTDEPRYRLIERGDLLPVTKSHTFKTEADGQRLIHFKFFSPDRVSESLDRSPHDEFIGEMWLSLDREYPRGTEVLVTAELDEQNSSLQMTAVLKNNPSVRVSSSFSRGEEDEEIAKEVEQTIRDLNQAEMLTERGVQSANELAGEAITAANQIRDRQGRIQPDRREAAQAKLQELKAFASPDRTTALQLIAEFEFILEDLDFDLAPAQEQRIQKLVKNLQSAVDRNDVSAMQKYTEDAATEFGNLPDRIKLLCVTKDAIANASYHDPSAANSMAATYQKLISALRIQNNSEAERLWRQLQPQASQYLDREVSSGSIATGLTR